MIKKKSRFRVILKNILIIQFLTAKIKSYNRPLCLSSINLYNTELGKTVLNNMYCISGSGSGSRTPLTALRAVFYRIDMDFLKSIQVFFFKHKLYFLPHSCVKQTLFVWIERYFDPGVSRT